jgi:hypothetical protein
VERPDSRVQCTQRLNGHTCQRLVARLSSFARRVRVAASPFSLSPSLPSCRLSLSCARNSRSLLLQLSWHHSEECRLSSASTRLQRSAQTRRQRKAGHETRPHKLSRTTQRGTRARFSVTEKRIPEHE